ncbi:MAG: TrmB family transcriptional regulator [Promethearchaeota archaeon]
MSLKAIGLTDYEISIYLTLISRGPMDARELSEASGVPYSRVYNVLTQLEKEKMWIIKEEESRPSRYIAKSPEEALIISRKQTRDSFDFHSNKIIQALTQVYHSHDVPLKIPLYIHGGINACLNKILGLIQQASSSIYILCIEHEFLEAIQEDIAKAKSRGVRTIKILLEDVLLKKEGFKELVKIYRDQAEIRFQKNLFANLIVIDKGAMATVVLTQESTINKAYFGIFTDYMAFGPIVYDLFKFLYKTARNSNI